MPGPEIEVVIREAQGAVAEHARVVGFARVPHPGVARRQPVVAGPRVELRRGRVTADRGPRLLPQLMMNTYSHRGNDAAAAGPAGTANSETVSTEDVAARMPGARVWSASASSVGSFELGTSYFID